MQCALPVVEFVRIIFGFLTTEEGVRILAAIASMSVIIAHLCGAFRLFKASFLAGFYLLSGILIFYQRTEILSALKSIQKFLDCILTLSFVA